MGLLAGPLITWMILTRPPEASSEDAVGPGAKAEPMAPGPQAETQTPTLNVTPAQQASELASSAKPGERQVIAGERVLSGQVLDGQGAPVAGAEVFLVNGVTVQGLGWLEGERMWQLTKYEQTALRHTQSIFSGAGFEVDMPDTWSPRELNPRGIVATTRSTEAGRFRFELSEDALDIPHSIVASRFVESAGGLEGSVAGLDSEWQIPRAVGLWRTDLIPVRDLTPLTLEFFEPGGLVTDVRIPKGLQDLPNSQAILTLDDLFVESVDLVSFATRESQAFLGLEPGRYTLRIEAGCGRWKIHEEAYDVLPGATTHTDPIKLGSALTLYRLELVNEYGRAPDADLLTVQDALTGKTYGSVRFDDPAGHLDLIVPTDLGALRLTTYTQGSLDLTPALGVSALDAEVARHRKVTMRL